MLLLQQKKRELRWPEPLSVTLQGLGLPLEVAVVVGTCSELS